MATKTSVIVLCEEAVLIWAIPPLSPRPPDFFHHNPPHMPPPLFTIQFPPLHHARLRWNRISSWYFGSSHPLYFDMICQGSKFLRFQIMLKSDLSTASLQFINTSELSPYDFDYVFFQDFRICEDTLVSCWFYDDHDDPDQYQCGVYTGLTSRFAVISHGGPATKMLLPNIGRRFLLFSCPASGRFVLVDSTNSVSVVDLF